MPRPTSCTPTLLIHVLPGEILGVLCQHCGPDVFAELQPVLVTGIEDNIDRDAEVVAENPELVEKLHHFSSSFSDENERVGCCLITSRITSSPLMRLYPSLM